MKTTRKESELTEREYIDLLDDIYGEVEICGMKYSSGQALLELDPIAFRSGKSDYESQHDDENPD